MLEMRSICERCDTSLDGKTAAFICSYECTFCETCAGKMNRICPNCSGELVNRPRIAKQPVDTFHTSEWSAKLSGACHCGAVQFELAHEPGSLTECNCSICRRYGALWAYYTRATARVLYPPGAVTYYSWNDKEIEFCHCNHCGCMTHYESMEKQADSRIAVNTRMLEESELTGVPLKYFDGAVSWKYLDN